MRMYVPQNPNLTVMQSQLELYYGRGEWQAHTQPCTQAPLLCRAVEKAGPGYKAFIHGM